MACANIIQPIDAIPTEFIHQYYYEITLKADKILPYDSKSGLSRVEWAKQKWGNDPVNPIGVLPGDQMFAFTTKIHPPVELYKEIVKESKTPLEFWWYHVDGLNSGHGACFLDDGEIIISCGSIENYPEKLQLCKNILN